MHSPLLLLTTALALGPSPVRANPQGPPENEELARLVAEHVEELAAAGAFSGAVLVARGEEVLFREAYGFATRRFEVPNRPDTKFNLGSMNKMFTGVAICQLVEAGKLDFDTPVGDALPDYPNAEVREKVTVHHLLTHTSGMGSYWNEAWERDWKHIRTVEDHLRLFQDDPLSFEPGERFQYSNAGPIVLGLIIEELGGMSYDEYIREKVTGPLGMDSTDTYAIDEPVPNLQ